LHISVPKCTKLHLYFQKFSRDVTPGPRNWEAPSPDPSHSAQAHELSVLQSYRGRWSHDEVDVDGLSRVDVDKMGLLTSCAPFTGRHCVTAGMDQHMHALRTLQLPQTSNTTDILDRSNLGGFQIWLVFF